MSPECTKGHCCESMRYWADYRCEQHPDPAVCPKNMVFYSAAEGTYGIRIHDGGSSYTEIKHCPWCGANLSPNKAIRGARRKRRVPKLERQRAVPMFAAGEFERIQ